MIRDQGTNHCFGALALCFLLTRCMVNQRSTDRKVLSAGNFHHVSLNGRTSARNDQASFG